MCEIQPGAIRRLLGTMTAVPRHLYGLAPLGRNLPDFESAGPPRCEVDPLPIARVARNRAARQQMGDLQRLAASYRDRINLGGSPIQPAKRDLLSIRRPT